MELLFMFHVPHDMEGFFAICTTNLDFLEVQNMFWIDNIRCIIYGTTEME